MTNIMSYISKTKKVGFSVHNQYTDIIDTADTRQIPSTKLGLAISASLNKPIEETKFGLFTM